MVKPIFKPETSSGSKPWLATKRLLAAVLPVAIAAVSLPAQAANGRLQTLTGAAAASYRLPASAQLIDTLTPESGALQVFRYRQRVGQAEVLGGQLTVFRTPTGDTTGVIGRQFDQLKPRNQVRLTAQQARQIAINILGDGTSGEVKLMLDPETQTLFYAVETLQAGDGSMSRWFHWIDAQSGQVINAYDGLTTACQAGQGLLVSGACAPLQDPLSKTALTKSTASGYQLTSADRGTPRQRTYDSQNATLGPLVLGTLGVQPSDRNNAWDTPGRTSPGHPALVSAHVYARVTDVYLQRIHNFDWLTHYPQGMQSTAHVSTNFANAFWNGRAMYYGDGDGQDFIEMSGDLDVVAHELSHGVTEATSNLIYQDEPGALNEAFSDIMAAAVEYHFCLSALHGTANQCAADEDTWNIGEDVMPNDNGIRDMADPNEDQQPSHYSDRYTGSQDNGGVHINSGIANHWFYLLVNGGQNANPNRATGTNVVGVGMPTAEEIAFLGFTSLPDNADFCTARQATITVANLVSSASTSVADAWDEVGISSQLCN